LERQVLGDLLFQFLMLAVVARNQLGRTAGATLLTLDVG
jgi:hypothetical protein